jgi:hypothetical protein
MYHSKFETDDLLIKNKSAESTYIRVGVAEQDTI